MLTVAMLRAALDMRYDHQPPSRLSLIEPTRAERLTMMACARGYTAEDDHRHSSSKGQRLLPKAIVQ